MAKTLTLKNLPDTLHALQRPHGLQPSLSSALSRRAQPATRPDRRRTRLFWMLRLSAAPFIPSGASNQVHLQGLHALKTGITGDHHGVWAQLHTASRLQGIWSAQPMVGTQLRCQFNHCGVQFDNQQIRLGKQRLKTIEAGLIAPPQRRYTTLQKAEAAHGQRKIRCIDGKLLQGCLGGFGPRGLTVHQVDQGAGIEEGNHQSRSAVSSASISALLRGFVDGGRASSHCSADASATGARDACN